MQKKIDKTIVEQRFRKSMPTYDEEAIAQQQMARQLVDILIRHYGNRFEKILEIGTGTGFLTRLLVEKLTFDRLYANDLVEESAQYLKKIKSCIQFIHGDIEQVDLPEKLDLIVSNASLQWVQNLPGLVSNLHAAMKQDAILAFTTFGPDNYREIARVTNTKLNYSTIDELMAVFKPLFEVVDSSEDRIALAFKSPLAVLKHVKKSGTNSIRAKNWKKSDLEEFERKYLELFKNCTEVELTYHPYFFLFKKEAN